MRTFIAVPLPAESHELLAGMQQELKAAEAEVRWTAAKSIHLTLKFLGEVEPAEIPRMAGLLREACRRLAPFGLSLRGLGAFPGLRNPRVVWCGVEGGLAALGELQRRVEGVCEGLGFAREQRGFSPHLTLGRVKGRRNLHRLADCIKIGSPREQSFEVNAFHIYRSTLTPQGALYDILETIDLEG